jgi:hypothetical protein
MSRGIQPIWIKIENRSKDPYWFVPHRLDPEYYSAMEAANIACGSRSTEAKKRVYDHFYDLRMTRCIPPWQTRKGFVFTKFEHGIKHLIIKVIGKSTKRLIFAVEVPGPEMDYQQVHFDGLYKDQEIIDVVHPLVTHLFGCHFFLGIGACNLDSREFEDSQLVLVQRDVKAGGCEIDLGVSRVLRMTPNEHWAEPFGPLPKKPLPRN